LKITISFLITLFKSLLQMNTLTIKINNLKARRLLKNLVDEKLIEIIGETNINWNPKKTKQAKDLLLAINEVEKHEKGILTLKSAKDFLNEI
jgi:hypothetical protein